MEENIERPALIKNDEHPKKINTPAIILAVFLVITVGMATTFGIMWLNEKSKANNTVVSNENQQVANTEKVDEKSPEPETGNTVSEQKSNYPKYVFSTDKIVNPDESLNYQSIEPESVTGCPMGYPRISFENPNVATVVVNAGHYKDVYQTDFAGTVIQDVSFDKKVAFVGCAGWGQMNVYGTIIYGLEDGSVEYTSMKRVTSGDGIVRSHGKIDGLKNIVKLYAANVNPKGAMTGGGYTTLAQDIDGNFYDLQKLLSE